jgi:hypothetical protein
MTTAARAITINDAYPWGRSLDEYRRMFSLGDGDLHRRIVGCGDGPASFNAAMTRMGHRVVSCDPLYQFSRDEIQDRIESTRELMIQRAREAAHRFVWNQIRSPEHMAQIRMSAMSAFLTDYDQGKRQGRYLPQSLPRLDLPDGSFDLALCSHFLFLYVELSLDFHLASILEMLRIATEVRIFPILDMNGMTSEHVKPVTQLLRCRGLSVSIERVDYEFQCNGNQMMRVTR